MLLETVGVLSRARPFSLSVWLHGAERGALCYASCSYCLLVPSTQTRLSSSCLRPCTSPGAGGLRRGNPVPWGDIHRCLETPGRGRFLACGRWGPGVLISTPQCPRCAPTPAEHNLARCQQCPGWEPCLVPTSGRLGSDPRAGKHVVSTIVQRQ